MNFIKQYPLFTAYVAICVIGFCGGVYMVVDLMLESGDASKEYKRTMMGRTRAVTMSPRPTDATLKASSRNVEQLYSDLDAKVSSIRSSSNKDIAAGMPSGANASNALYFNITEFIDKYRAAVTDRGSDDKGNPRADVKLGSDDFTFGFGYFIDTRRGPPTEFIRDVYVQRQVLDYLLENLIESDPITILSVNRNPVSIRVDGTETQDFFTINKGVSAAVPNAVDTQSFRFRFTGYTSSLRAFLNAISNYDWPLSVRSVVVSLANESNDDYGSLDSEPSDGMPQAEDPIVTNNISEYEVIVELIEINPNFAKRQSDTEEETEDS